MAWNTSLQRASSWPAIFVVVAAAWLFDLWLLPGFSGGALYLPAIWLAGQGAERQRVLMVAAICTILLMLDFVLAPKVVAPLWLLLADHALAMTAIWILAAILCYRNPFATTHVHAQKAAEPQRESNDDQQRRLYEEALTREKERAEQAQRAAEVAMRVRSEFLANVSHELRTPMNSILGMLQLTREEELSPTSREYLATAHDSAQALLDLLNDILDFSRLELGKFTIDEAPFDLRAMVDEAIKTIAPTAFTKGLEVVCDIGPDIPARVIGDEVRLRQIILNLVGNAVKFTEKGEIVVSVCVERLWASEARLKFSVRDTGVGIAPRDQQRIFEAFAQADASTTRKHGGVGLGLAICSELLRRMGSRLKLVSELGRGSEFQFVISFPYVSDDTLANNVTTPHIDGLRGVPVLVVDDNETNRRILEQTLRNWQMQPVVAADAEQGLALAKQASQTGQPFPVALIDALMPGVDGLTLSDMFRKDREIGHPPVVLMISSADRLAFSQRTNELNVAAFLTKPVSQADLLTALVQSLELAPVDTTLPGANEPSAPARPMSILLAEDTPANQKVVRSVLVKRGHAVSLAQNGREAVDLVRTHDFDVILMDVQMPIMDGYQATAAIRRLQDAAPRPTPIVAMTAHAMRGDREKCLAAGMDAYLAKPVDVKELLTMVEEIGREERPARPQHNVENVAVADGSPRVIDVDAAMSRLGSDMDLFCELAELFAEDAPQLVSKIERAIEEQDGATLQRAAHSIKGLAANFGAARCVGVAQELESLGKNRAVAQASPLLNNLRGCLDELSAALAPYRKS